VKSIILSNHTVVGINNQLQRLKIGMYFDTVFANEDLNSFVKGTTKKQKFASIVKNSGLKPTEIIIIGDSPEEVELGKSVGVTSIAVTGGHYNRARLVNAHPTFLISNLREVVEIIQKINLH
jgi:phosphoglycolate phosphatase-like HAD superfamily hydrolase